MNRKKMIIIISICLILILIICLILYVLYKMNTKKVEENLPIEKRQEGGENYKDSQLNNFDITIEGTERNIKKEITDMDDFKLQFKKFIYLNGLVDANTAIITSYEIDNNEMTISIQLNNPAQTKVICIVNISEQTYAFSKE